MAPKGTLLKLIRKAEHPENRQVSLFQTFIKITHAKTRFAKIQSIGARLSQELYFRTLQGVFNRQISFGHLCLIRSQDFIRIKIPKGILSHDIWDTTYLDLMGKRIAFCHDVKSWDEAPANYLEARARDKRWAKGTLQSWPLIFKPGVSLETRLFVFYGIYVYWSHLILLFWLILNAVLADTSREPLLFFKSNNTLFFSPFMRQELLIGLLLTLVVIYGHKFVLLKRFKLKDIVVEIIFSTLISLNNIYYQTIDILTLPFEGLVWKPMKKDPFSTVTLKQVAENLWPTTAIGFLGLYYGVNLESGWIWLSFPLLISFALSIPVVYWTARPARSSSII
jgi:membrane glycosyltransferase